MSHLDITHRAAGVAALVVLLAGCNGLQAQTALPSTQRSPAYAHGAGRVASWMDPAATKADLLYVSDDRGSVEVFSYPDGKPEGILTGFNGPSGLCSDRQGDVFITDTGNQDIIEYPHGGTQPIANLMEFQYYPYGCSVDATSGNLAVTNFDSNPAGPGSVSIWTNARGAPRTYTAPGFNVYLFCGYDDRGNLYINGANVGTTQTQFALLPQGGTSFVTFSVNQHIGYPGGIQWDGRAVAIEDVSTDTLYRVKVSGSTGTVVGSSQLNARSHLVVQFWIQGRTIIVPYGVSNRDVKKVGFWPYPAGGSPTSTIAVRKAAELVGATVSLAK